jgi:ABC-type transport system substrate-binding protein
LTRIRNILNIWPSEIKKQTKSIEKGGFFMKRSLGLAVLILFATLIFCPGQSPAQVSGGTVIYAAGADPDNLDPANAESNPSEAVNRMMYENLARFDEKLKIVPGLATRWEQSKDGLSWTFFLRKGITFHDGTPFNADAVKVFVERMVGPEKPSRAGLYVPFVKSVEVVDGSTVKIHLKAPFAFFLNNLAHSASGIISPAALKTYGKDISRRAVGTGPFKFVEWVHGDHLTMVRNDAYWGGRPYLDKIIVKTVKEDSARVMMLQSGDAHLIVRIPSEDIPRLEKDARIKLDSTETLRVLYVAINCSKKPFTDIRVRQALHYAVDKEAIVKNLYQGRALVSQGMVAPLTTGYFPVRGYPYDPERAKKLLAEAGFPNGFKAKLWSPQGRYPKDFEMAQAIQQQLKKVNIDCTLDTMEWAAYLAATRKPPEQNESEIFLLGWAPSSAEARWILYPLFATDQWVPGGNNRVFFSNKEFDEMVDKFTRATTKADMERYLKAAQELLSRESPTIPILVTKETIGYTQKLKGVINSPLELTYFDAKTYLEK